MTTVEIQSVQALEKIEPEIILKAIRALEAKVKKLEAPKRGKNQHEPHCATLKYSGHPNKCDCNLAEV